MPDPKLTEQPCDDRHYHHGHWWASRGSEKQWCPGKVLPGSSADRQPGARP